MKKIELYILKREDYIIHYIAIDNFFVYGNSNEGKEGDWGECAPNQTTIEATSDIKFARNLTKTEMDEMLFLEMV